jgi:hypothetical protein
MNGRRRNKMKALTIIVLIMMMYCAAPTGPGEVELTENTYRSQYVYHAKSNTTYVSVEVHGTVQNIGQSKARNVKLVIRAHANDAQLTLLHEGEEWICAYLMAGQSIGFSVTHTFTYAGGPGDAGYEYDIRLVFDVKWD